MVADQLLRRRSGGYARASGVGALRYNVDRTHSHWHLLPFDQYELRTLDGRAVGSARKSGFCLTSGRRAAGTVVGKRPRRRLRSTCGKNDRRALRVLEGISVGYGDSYAPLREGQYVDVTDVPAGDYVLVHRVNVGRRLRESDYSNNAASLRIRLLPAAGASKVPQLRVLARCQATATC